MKIYFNSVDDTELKCMTHEVHDTLAVSRTVALLDTLDAPYRQN